MNGKTFHLEKKVKAIKDRCQEIILTYEEKDSRWETTTEDTAEYNLAGEILCILDIGLEPDYEEKT